MLGRAALREGALTEERSKIQHADQPEMLAVRSVKSCTMDEDANYGEDADISLRHSSSKAKGDTMPRPPTTSQIESELGVALRLFL